MPPWTDLVQQATDGFLYGSTYALIAIGFTMIFGVMEKLNMAFGVTALLGAYVGAVVGRLLGESFLPVFLVAVVAAGVIGLVVQLACFQFMPVGYPLAPLIASVGMLFFIDEIIVQATEGMPYPFPTVLGDTMLEWGPWVLRGDLLLVFGVSVVATLALLFLIYRTRLGLATRAVSQQPIAAQLCGIRLTRVNNITFVLSGMLGGIAGAMTASAVGVLSPLLAVPITVKGLVAAVVGGLASIPGAIVAGLLIGVLEALSLQAFGVTYRDLLVLFLLFAFLIFRPGGIVTAGGGRE